MWIKGGEITRIRGEMKQPEFAEMLGIHSVTLSRYENEREPVPLYIQLALFEIARRLGVDPPTQKKGQNPRFK